MRKAAFVVAALVVAALAAAFDGLAWARTVPEPAPLAHRIAVDARGPLALVEVTRALAPTRTESGGAEALLDLALPDRSALAAVEVRDGGRWRPVESSALDRAPSGDLYRSESSARGVTPADEPFDDSAVFRVRIAHAGDARTPAPVEVRYRFACAAAYSGGRYRIRFPAAPERLPVPADVTVTARDAADVDIAGARAAASGSDVIGRASTRSGWEISWSPRDPAAGATEAPTLDARVATAPVSPTETAVAYAVRSRPARPVGPPSGVLFLIDRSRSVGLAGLSAERDLAHRLVEALPPTVRFDVLFFDRGTKRLFPMSRPATREAIEALEAAMVPSALQNGTDLAAALGEAGALLRREAMGFGPRTLLAVVTDGALPEAADGSALDRALGRVTGTDLEVATFVVRPPDDDPASPQARQALRTFAGARGGVARELRSNEIREVVPAALADLDRGGDIAAIRLGGGGQTRPVADALAPGAAVSGVLVVSGRPGSLSLEGTTHGRRIGAAPHPARIASSWLSPWAAPAGVAKPRLLVAHSLVALVEPVVRPAVDSEPVVKGSMDRMVMRNVLSLAYMPRARACYLDRTGATAALRDLTGRVRLAIDVARGEVERVVVESSSLDHAEIERCLREGAFAIEVPRAVRSDAAVTAVLNLVFRPSTPEKKQPADLGAVGDQIDLIIEEAQRREEAEATSGSAPPSGMPAPSPVPTR